ncbi:MAG: hypothetical protein NTZ33_11775 [Bacteroidetes bacterium]|nr:hypothetical protein [Bacteroidota bacterium]
MSKKICLLYLLLSGLVIQAQQLNYPLANPFLYQIDKAIYSPENIFHTSVKPYLTADIDKIISTDSVQQSFILKHDFGKKFPNTVWNKIFNEHLFTIDKDGFKATIDPVFNFEFGKEVNGNKSYNYVNTRGFLIEGNIGKQFSFSTTFYENQASFPDYLSRNILNTQVVPGQGMIRLFGKNAFDFAWASGYISYTPSKYFNFQFGHGKNFIGDGYRSLLLSDNAFNYPYLKITTNVWRFKYTNLYAEFQDLKTPHTYDLGFHKKYGTFHYLSYAVNKRLNIGLFEAIIWNAQDSSGYRGFDVNYLNPVIFYRPVEFSLGSPDNALIGTNISYKIADNYVLYGQILIDEFKLSEILARNGWWGNKQAFQIGAKAFDLFNIKSLYLQTEFNYVKPYTYSHRSSLQNYGHYNEALAHPVGANFWESVTIVKYSYKRFFAEYKLNYICYGEDSAGVNFGKDIFRSYDDHPRDYNNFLGQGIKTNLIYNDLRLSYLVNPSANLNISIGITDRYEFTDSYKYHTAYFYIGLRTSLHNFYYDF